MPKKYISMARREKEINQVLAKGGLTINRI